MATRMQQRRGTAAQWISVNNGSGPILAAGEIGFESDTNKFKIGDGVNHWVDLTYFTDAASAIDSLVDGAPDLLNTLNELAAALGDDPDFINTVATNLSDHTSSTTNVHGIEDTAQLATISYVDGAVAGAAVNESELAGYGLSWNLGTSQFDVDGSVFAKVSDVADVYAPKDSPTFINLVTAADLQADSIGVNNNLTANNVIIEGNLTVAGTQSIVNSTNLSITDNIIYLNEAVTKPITAAVGNGTSVTYTIDNADSLFVAGNIAVVTGITPSGLNTDWSEILSVTETSFTLANTSTATYTSGGSAESKAALNPDLGFVGGYKDGSGYAHAGFVKDSSSGTWKIFEGVVPEPSGSIDFTTYTKGNLEVGQIEATSAIIGNVDNGELQTLNGINKAYTIQEQFDTKAPSVDATLENPTITVTDGNHVINPFELGTLAGITGNIQDQLDLKAVATDVESALALKVNLSDLASKADVSDFNAHTAQSLNVHGIADTSALVTTDILQEQNTDIWNALGTKASTDAPTFTGSVVLPSTTSIGDVSGTELSYVNGVTSAIQTQLDDKALDADLSSHTSSSTNVHGIADTAALATKTYVDNAGSALQTNIDAKAPIASPTFTGTVSGITKSMVGLGNVDNTADADKPVSTATQTALDAKASLSGATFTGAVSGTSLTLSGNLTVNGTTTTVSSQNLEVTDPLIYIGTGNSANSKDLGIVGHFSDGTYQHTGLTRDASDGKWKLFSGVTTEPSDTIDFTTWTKDTLVLGSLEATTVTPSSGIVFSDGTQTLAGTPSLTPINTPTASITLGSSYVKDSFVRMNVGSANTITIAPDSTYSYPVGASLDFQQIGAGQTSFVAGSGVTFQAASVNGTMALKFRGQFSVATALKVAANTWAIFGDLTN
jgi:hypothetical protein